MTLIDTSSRRPRVTNKPRTSSAICIVIRGYRVVYPRVIVPRPRVERHRRPPRRIVPLTSHGRAPRESPDRQYQSLTGAEVTEGLHGVRTARGHEPARGRCERGDLCAVKFDQRERHRHRRAVLRPRRVLHLVSIWISRPVDVVVVVVVVRLGSVALAAVRRPRGYPDDVIASSPRRDAGSPSLRVPNAAKARAGRRHAWVPNSNSPSAPRCAPRRRVPPRAPAGC